MGLILDCAGAALTPLRLGTRLGSSLGEDATRIRVTAAFRESLGGQGHFLSFGPVPNLQSPSDALGAQLRVEKHPTLGEGACFSKAFVRNSTLVQVQTASRTGESKGICLRFCCPHM